MERRKSERLSEGQDEHYEPLLAHSERPPSAVVVLQGGGAPGQPPQAGATVQASILDIAPGSTSSTHVVAAGIPMDPSTATQGQLVFMPDLANVVTLWHGQRLIMVVWLISSLVSLVLFAPLFMASGLFLAAEIGAVLGIIASVVQLCERNLAATNTLELGAQMKLVASCGVVACFLDGFTVCLDLLLLWKMGCDPEDAFCATISKFAFVFALGCVHHGLVSWVVANRTHSLMPLLNPVTSGAVRL